MNLEGELFRTRGRAAKPLLASVVRELEENDLVLLDVEKGSKPQHIKRLKDRHHALARNLARGDSPSQAALKAGYSISRVSILQDDPQFKELLEFYRKDVDAVYAGVDTRLAAIANDAAELLQERLEEEPDKISTNQLMELTKMGADRTGFGPASSSTNLNVNVDMSERLKLARQRVAARKFELIEGSKND